MSRVMTVHAVTVAPEASQLASQPTFLADDAAALFERWGLGKPYLFGHSMGARTAARLMQTIPTWFGPIVPKTRLASGEATASESEWGASGRWQWVFDLRRFHVRSASPGVSL